VLIISTFFFVADVVAK
jgi:hypothetical protein